MAKGKLFEYAVLYHPKEKKDVAGNPTETKKSVIVTPLTSVIASSDKEVGMIASRSIPAEYGDMLDDIEVLVRPL